MQRELDAEGPSTPIQILGINGMIFSSGNPIITAGRDLPWLQDTIDEYVWAAWDAFYRALFVLDGDNALITVYHLAAYDLSHPADYERLKTNLLAAAEAEAATP